jgi:hypothetical protein
MKTPEEKFLDALDKIIPDHEKNVSFELMAMLLIARSASLLDKIGYSPSKIAEVFASMALGADFQAVKEMVQTLENSNSNLTLPIKQKYMN